MTPDESPPSPAAASVATAIAFISSVGWSAASEGGSAIATALFPGGTAQGQMVASQLGSTFATTTWDALLGAWMVAAAVVVTAWWFGAPCRPLHRVFLGVWAPYAVGTVVFSFALILLLPGIAMAVLSLFLLDPVQRGEGRGLGLAVPGLPRAGLLALLCLFWMSLAAVVQLGAVYLHEQGAAAAVAGLSAYQFVAFGCWLAWCAILRRTAPAI